jgi:predicted nucleic acid-binding protein
VKLYADEDGHEHVRRLGALLVSALVRVEVPAALWRKHRMAELGPIQVKDLVETFEADLKGVPDGGPYLFVVGIGPALPEDAARLAALHSLRAYDAIQLSSARAVKAMLPRRENFACFDKALRDAAEAEGFTLIP